MVEMSKKCVRKAKVGETPNIPHPQCERSIKIPVFKQQQVANTGTKNGGGMAGTRGRYEKSLPGMTVPSQDLRSTQILGAPILYINGPSSIRGSPEYPQ